MGALLIYLSNCPCVNNVCVSRTCKRSTMTCWKSPKLFGTSLQTAPKHLTSCPPTIILQPPVRLPRTRKQTQLATIKPKHLTWIALIRNSLLSWIESTILITRTGSNCNSMLLSWARRIATICRWRSLPRQGRLQALPRATTSRSTSRCMRQGALSSSTTSLSIREALHSVGDSGPQEAYQNIRTYSPMEEASSTNINLCLRA